MNIKSKPAVTELEAIFMQRDNMTTEEAAERLEEMRQSVVDGMDPEEVLSGEGLEPDYIFDIV
jgi:hypothetical protein